MIPRALFFAALLPLSALAQLQVFEFDGTNDTPVGTVVNLGAWRDAIPRAQYRQRACRN